MATRFRLQRHGRKGYAFYYIVIADSNAPRDGRFVEKVGTYNPNTNPSTVVMDFNRALYWVQAGAQPTDTVRSILSKEGVYLMKHLLGGVKKGAFDMDEAKAKFNAWKQEKENKFNGISDAEAAQKKAAYEARIKAEKEVQAAIAKRVAEKHAAAVEETPAEEAPATEEAPAAE